MRSVWILIGAALLVSAGGLWAGDSEIAAAMAKSAVPLIADGKIEKGKKLCYQALAYDEECPEAMYELGKIFEQEGKPLVAGDFLVRAARNMSKDKANPAYASKIVDAQQRAKGLNPYATRLASSIEDYAQELSGILKKAPDRMTQDEAYERSTSLQFTHFVPPERLPKFEKSESAKAPPPKPKTPEDPDPTEPLHGHRPGAEKKEEVTNVPLEVERTLKQGGWTTIKGTWTKKAPNVYEVTDGRLESQKTNGAVSVVVQTGGKGTVAAFVRNAFRGDWDDFGDYDQATGFGARIKGGKCMIYAPSTFSTSGGDENLPYRDHDVLLPDGNPKNVIMVQIQGNRIETFINGKREKLTTYKVSEGGPMAIVIKGTMTIETPQVGGQ